MSLLDLERESITKFVTQAATDGYLEGRVLDYGCGRQPYRHIVEAAGGTYMGYDSPNLPGSVVSEEIGGPINARTVVDAFLVTQVIQYVLDPLEDLLGPIHDDHLVPHGFLVMTYPTHWPEIEVEDLWRFTKAGMERLLTSAGFEIIRHERRAELVNRDGTWALGYGVIARA